MLSDVQEQGVVLSQDSRLLDDFPSKVIMPRLRENHFDSVDAVTNLHMEEQSVVSANTAPSIELPRGLSTVRVFSCMCSFFLFWTNTDRHPIYCLHLVHILSPMLSGKSLVIMCTVSSFDLETGSAITLQ